MNEPPMAGIVVAISGGTRGLGRVTASFLASQGASVAVCSRSGSDAEATAELLRKTHGAQTYGAALDVTNPEAARGFARDVEQSLGPIDVLINNAAVIGPVGELADVSMSAWSDTIDINLKGVANMTSAFHDQLARSATGRVINVSGGGVGGPDPMRRSSAYVASKYAVIGLTEVLARDLEQSGTTVNAVAPGPIPTTFLDDIVALGPERAGEALFEDASHRSQTVDRAVAEQSAAEGFLALLAYLVSPSSAWLTGRLLSARWEKPARLEQQSSTLTSSQYKLRRIDQDLFTEPVT